MKAWVWLFLSVAVATTGWLYAQRVLAPWEYQTNVVRGTLKAALGDLYSPWTGTRGLLLFGRNPYSREVTDEIQMAFYGRQIVQNYSSSVKPVDEQRFAYPVYVAFLIAPTIHLSFPEAQRWVKIALAILIAASVPLWLAFLGWKPPVPLVVAIILFTLASPPVMQALSLRQLGILVEFLLALSAWCVAKGNLGAAGAFLAIATIKPQMLILPLAWFMLWSISEWRSRWRLLLGFFSTFVALFAGGQWLLAGWFRFFLSNLDAYRRYTYRISLLQLSLGEDLGVICSAILLMALFWFAWRNRNRAGDSQAFVLVLAATMVVAVLALPLLPQFNQMMLLLPVLLLLSRWPTLSFATRSLIVVCVAWPTVTAIALLLLPLDVRSASKLPLLPWASAPFFPFVIGTLLALWRPVQSPDGKPC